MMKKLTLDLDALQVESFETAAPGAARGTVRGYDTDQPPVNYIDTMQASCTGCASMASCPAAACVSAACGTAHTECGQDTCGNWTCGFTFCANSCDWCDSFYTDKPELC